MYLAMVVVAPTPSAMHALFIHVLIQILGAVANVREGRLRARFHADDWPTVSAVVCQVFHPRISDVSLHKKIHNY